MEARSDRASCARCGDVDNKAIWGARQLRAHASHLSAPVSRFDAPQGITHGLPLNETHVNAVRPQCEISCAELLSGLSEQKMRRAQHRCGAPRGALFGAPRFVTGATRQQHVMRLVNTCILNFSFTISIVGAARGINAHCYKRGAPKQSTSCAPRRCLPRCIFCSESPLSSSAHQISQRGLTAFNGFR